MLHNHKTTPDLQDQDQNFWSQTGLVLRPTVSDHITGMHAYCNSSAADGHCRLTSVIPQQPGIAGTRMANHAKF